jgi:hypothetical protein
MTKLLNQCQARWSQLLSQFNFKIVYCPGTAGGKPDALTRRSGDPPKVGDDRSLENQTTTIKPKNILQLSAMAKFTPASPVLVQLFTDGYNEDPFPNKILKLIRDGAKHCREMSLPECDEHNNLLYYHQRIWVPNYQPLKLYLLQQHHDIPAAGHPADQKPSNTVAEITPSQKCEWTLTTIPIIVTPANIQNQVGMHHLEYYAPCLFQIDPGRTYQWIL